MVAIQTKKPNVNPVEGVLVRILDQGEVLTLQYDGAMTKHTRSLWWGTAVGYRAMQAAAIGLSEEGRLWSRDHLYVVSGHPGPGVIDAIDYVTKCVERDRCHVIQNPNCMNRCNSAMAFEWWVSDQEKTVKVKLRSDFLTPDFYALADRLGTDNELDDDRRTFEIAKVNLSTRIWNGALEENFTIEQRPTPLKPGELPHDAPDLSKVAASSY